MIAEAQKAAHCEKYDQSLPARFIRTLFSPESDKETAMTHLQYLECQSNEQCIDRLVTKLGEQYNKEILKFGHDNFKEVLKMCQDRRTLFKLIQKVLTFD